ncbi:zinc finger and BTB domain-containing protein 5 [Grus japonensis]|uniref:Zinc finger and BTB domain-containing protein 5 n=1 Tax=Grus japonensis TaxID=30415 RepID=A0ABC9WL06_GRUJA
MVRQAVPLQPMEDDGGADIHLQPMEDPMSELKEAVTLWEAHAGAGSWQDLWTRGERSPRQSRFAGRTCDPVGDPCWSSLLLKVCTPWKGPTLEQLVKNCSPWEGLMLEKFMEDCLPWEGPHAGARAECEESSP